MVLVVFSSLRCVRAQRRRAHCGLLVPLGKLVSTLLALRKKQLRYKLQQVLVRLLRMQVCRSAALRRSNSSPVRCCSTQACAMGASKAEPRLCEPSLRVTTDPETPFQLRLGSLAGVSESSLAFQARDEGIV